MDTKEFIANFADAVEIEPDKISESTQFKDLDKWDSLCILSVIAMVDQIYEVTLGGEDLESANTIKDVILIIKSRR